MNQSRVDNDPTPHLRVILPTSMESNMPPSFLRMHISPVVESFGIKNRVTVLKASRVVGGESESSIRPASSPGKDGGGGVCVTARRRKDRKVQESTSALPKTGLFWSFARGGHRCVPLEISESFPKRRSSHRGGFPKGVPMAPGSINDIPPPTADFSAPPPYDIAANSKLPTYEEVQREKQLEGEGPHPIPPPGHPTFAFVTVEPTVETAEQLDPENSLLGTDIMFLTSFFMAFLFNWIGFLLLMCFCHTVASRYGALAGFGLSLAKWTLIVKHSTELASHENSWLWWLIMAFGILICVRAVIQYLNIKRGWRLLSGTAQERLLFFY